jgi:flavin-dependent dehydrogenase
MNEFDVVVVGGGFAGLNFARCAALNDLSVLVLEKDTIGSNVKTTGILIKRLVDEMNIPGDCIANRIKRMVLFSPDGRKAVLSRNMSRFFMGYTGRLLRWMAGTARDSGAEVKEESTYLRSDKRHGSMVVKYRNSGRMIEARTRYLVGCDGALSGVAREFGMDLNRRFLLGVEKVYRNVPMEDDAFYCFLDHEIAPGYLAWAAPKGDRCLVGLAGYQGRFDAEKSMGIFEERLSGILDLSRARLVRKRGGLMPINGMLGNIVNERCLLIGDSAGMMEAITAGGIYPSIGFSGAFSNLVADFLKNGDSRVLYSRSRMKHLQKRLDYAMFLRKLFDSLDSNRKLNHAFSLLERGEGKKLFEELFLGAGGTPKRMELLRLASSVKSYPIFLRMVLGKRH